MFVQQYQQIFVEEFNTGYLRVSHGPKGAKDEAKRPQLDVF